MSTKTIQYREHIMDKAARRAWLIIGIVAAIFMIGLVIVSRRNLRADQRTLEALREASGRGRRGASAKQVGQRQRSHAQRTNAEKIPAGSSFTVRAATIGEQIQHLHSPLNRWKRTGGSRQEGSR